MNSSIREIPLKKVCVRDNFWSPRQKLIAEETVPYMKKILMDEISGAEKSHAVKNFRIAAGLEKGEHYGLVFQDSDVYKWLEAAAYCLNLYPDTQLQNSMDEIIHAISLAQQEDGYINTYFTLREPDKKWSNLLECHELYCAGHLIEAAVACKEAAGRDDLLSVAERVADNIINVFGSDGIPGHQEIEIALLRLYSATGKNKYLQMACDFIDRRGTDSEWFAKHTPKHPGIHYGGYDIDCNDTVYNQSYAPVREQTEARGHAVRCLYMLTAMAHAAAHTGDKTLKTACDRLFNDIRSKRMYVTGGVGSRAFHESFGSDWELPNDRAYNETCASVAMAFFMYRMLQNECNSEYTEVLELELYNGALAGMQLDGKRFFYVNPLFADPNITSKTENTAHVLIHRPPWYSCACCPPNLARLISSAGRFLWSETDTALYSHLMIGNTLSSSHADVTLTSALPWEGFAEYHFDSVTEGLFDFMLRIPKYAANAQISINGRQTFPEAVNGYSCLRRAWKAGDVVTVTFDMPVRRYYENANVKEDIGRVALIRGPLVYCMEQQDNTIPLDECIIPPELSVSVLPYDESLLGGIVPLEVNGMRFIPYYSWANREECAMQVFVREY